MRLRLVLAVLLTLSAACGGSGDATGASVDVPEPSTTSESPTTTTTEAPTTTAPAPTTTEAAEPARFDERGPWQVGVATLDLGDRRADVYYPAMIEPGAQTEIFNSLDVFPEEFQAFIPDELTGLYDTTAYRDTTPADEAPYPVMAYSHGFGAFRQVASFHTSHVASWGFIVVTTDHLERGLAAQVRGELGGGAENQDVLDVLAALDALAAHPELGPIADLDRVAITGHSAGGWTAARAAREEVFDVYLSIASGAPEIVTQKPAIVFVGENDQTVVPERSYELFEQLNDAVLVTIENAGHNSFSDSCEGIYELGGLDMLAELIGAEQVERAEDGCVPPSIEPRRSFDTLNHYTVQFLLAQLVDRGAAGELIDTSDLITPLADFRVVGDPLG